jgi:3-phenylpropionate/cinnamic acid dioxygenase small subunit
VGADAVRDVYERTVRRHSDGTPRTRHLTTNAVVEVAPDGRTARCRSVFVVLQATDALALQPIVAGRYDDRFARGPDGWRFSHRHIVVERTGVLREHQR